MSQTLNVLSAIAYSQPMSLQEALEQQSSVEEEAIAVSPPT
jgi:chromosome segregation and condensation protein ScpB